MKKQILIFFFLSVLLISLFNACTPQREIVYLQGDAKILETDTTTFVMKLFPGDIISVELYTVNPDAFPGLGIASEHTNGIDNRSAYEKGFVLDKNGMVSLPYLGNLNLSGLTIIDAHDTIVNRFKQYIDDPVIVLKKLSFKVSIVGEVNRPGLYYVPNEQLTLLEGLALAGDLTNYAERNNIKILRKTANGTAEIIVDLTSKNAFTGQSKFLYPDDIVYVSPTKKKRFTAVAPATTVITSIVATLVLVVAFYDRNN